MTALAKRAMACKGWRWMPGMRDSVDGDRLIDIGPLPDEPWPVEPRWLWSTGWAHDNEGHVWLVDLDDPATLGCLLALVREAHSDPCIHIAGDGCTWQPFDGNLDDLVDGYFQTEAEALVAALEAAP